MCTRCVPANTLTVSEAGAELKVSRQAILERINVGSPPARQMSSGWVIPRVGLLPKGKRQGMRDLTEDSRATIGNRGGRSLWARVGQARVRRDLAGSNPSRIVRSSRRPALVTM